MNKKSTLLILLLLLSLVLVACGGSPEAKLTKEGNDEFYQQAYDEAWALYQSAQMESPELAEPYYNAANALYKQGLYEEALQQMQMALQFADDEALAQQSFFNLGNSHFNLEDMPTAVAAYIEALLRNPDDADAKHNLELALAQQQQQEQEQDQQDQQDQQNQDENQDQQDQSQDGEGEQDQDQNGEGQQEQDQNQEGEGEQDQNQQDGEGEQDQQDQQNGENGDPQDQQNQDSQLEAGQEQDQNGQPQYVPAPGEKMTAEQAQQLLMAIAGQSDTLQERLGQMLIVPGRPPAQDW